MCRVGIGDVDGKERVGGGGGVGRDGVVAGYRGGLGAESSEFPGKSIDLCRVISLYASRAFPSSTYHRFLLFLTL